MPKRLFRLAVLLGAAALLLALPSASASAASPWWQVTTGSMPSNLWEPTDASETQEVTGESFFGLMFAARVEVGGETVGCLGSGTLEPFGGPSADELCETETGHPASETAAEFEAMLEGSYGAGQVEVSGGPAGILPFEVRSAWAPSISVSPLEVELFGEVFRMGTGVESKLLTEGSGRLLVTLTSLGDAPVDAASTPLTITDRLPEGVVAYKAEAVGGFHHAAGPVACALPSSSEATCTFEGELPPYEAIELEVFLALEGSPPHAGDPGEIIVSGGNAPSARAVQTIKVSDQPVRFGLESFSMQSEEEGGAITGQAGAHPFQVTNTIQANLGRATGSRRFGNGDVRIEQPAMPRNVRVAFPPGLIGNATVAPQCPLEKFLDITALINRCPDETAIGVASVTFLERSAYGLQHVAVPVFNLAPAHGEPARFGFVVSGVPSLINTSVSPDNGYRIVASVHNITQVIEFLATTLVVWGTPGDPRHDSSRGWSCTLVEFGPCADPHGRSETPFMRQPVSCDSPLDFNAEFEPWNVPLGSEVDHASFSGEAQLGCNRVPFDPKIASTPTSKLAESPSGLDFELNMPNSGLDSPKPGAIAEGQPKKVEVTLPEGMTVNPSEAEGLAVCAPAEYARESVTSIPGEGCPDASKIGSVQIATPLLEEEAKGALYLAKPYDNPFGSLLALYMVARIPDRGIIVKQAGKVESDPRTGQLVTTFDDLPQQPVESFKLHFREGARAPLVTPPACGTFQTVARFVPWSAQDPENPGPDEVVTRTSAFQIVSGPDNSPCPTGGLPSFHPGLIAGTLNNRAGSFSPFDVRLFRSDSEQEITHFSIKLPPGVVGKLAGIPFCPDAAIEAAKARTGPLGGHEELESPSCPRASEIGHTLAGAGVGPALAYAPGKVYLAGPYHGSAISIVAITAGVVGPFDIGTVVVREALKVNPETGEVFIDATGSDPIPHIIKGIPVHLRDIRVYTDRPEFVLNPTDCTKTSTASTVLGSGLDFASEADDNPVTVTTPFQAADCAALPFEPKLTFKLIGGTRRGAHPKLISHLSMHGIGESGVGFAQVTLPRSEFIENSHFDTICTRVQFNAGTVPGEQCPEGSVYGHAKAETPILDEALEGPVFLRSNPERELPDVVAALHSGKIDVVLDGHVDSVKGQIRTTFESVPDAPVTSFDIELLGQSKGLFVNSTNLCKGTHKVIANLTGQNGKVSDSRPKLKAKCPKARKHRAKRHKRRAH